MRIKANYLYEAMNECLTLSDIVGFQIGNQITIYATDGWNGILHKIPIYSHQPHINQMRFSISKPKEVQKLWKQLGKYTVDIEVSPDDQKLNISHHEFRYQVDIDRDDDIDRPLFQELSFENLEFKPIDLREFKRCIKKVSWMCARNDPRQFLTSINIFLYGDKTLFVASDGMFLGAVKSHLKLDLHLNVIVIERKVAELIAKMKSDQGFYAINGKYFIVREETIIGKKYIVAHLIEDSLLDISEFYPQKYIASFVVEREKILQVLQRLLAFTYKKDNHRIKLQVNGDELKISAPNAFEYLTPLSSWGNCEVELDGKRITRIIDNIDDNIVQIDVGGDITPIVITAKGEVYMMMPLL